MAQEAGQYKSAVPLLFITFKNCSLPDALSHRRHRPGSQPTTQTLLRIGGGTLSVHSDI